MHMCCVYALKYTCINVSIERCKIFLAMTEYAYIYIHIYVYVYVHNHERNYIHTHSFLGGPADAGAGLP